MPADTPNALHFVHCLSGGLAGGCVYVCVLQQVQSMRVNFTSQEGKCVCLLFVD